MKKNKPCDTCIFCAPMGFGWMCRNTNVRRVGWDPEGFYLYPEPEFNPNKDCVWHRTRDEAIKLGYQSQQQEKTDDTQDK